MMRGTLLYGLFVALLLCQHRPIAAQIAARGELAARIDLTHSRFLLGEMPAFTDDFILADVALRPDYPRRFADFSGDVSGRFLGAMALLPPPNWDAAALVKRIVEYQRADGRFGTESLVFRPSEIGPEHMALLWGNGRLLAGLVEYWQVSQDGAALAAARRNADFILEVRDACSKPEVAERLRGKAANGYICFTQIIEGLVMLFNATQDARYLEGAEQIAVWFQRPFETQHTHGYLTTLRGVMMLHAVTNKEEYLRTAEECYAAIVASPDYLIYGGMPEYFTNPNKRDEGCAIADFLRLSLQLWRATSKMEYLERAERCLFNHFYGNQFNTGDFGHDFLSDQGMVSGNGLGRAWWCCSMHGLRAFRDVLDSIAAKTGDGLRVDLFLDAQWRGDGLGFTLDTEEHGLRLTMDEAPAEPVTLAVRCPAWAQDFQVSLNGAPIDTELREGYRLVRRAWNEGDALAVHLKPRMTLLTRAGKPLTPAGLTEEPVEAALFLGPRLMGVDSHYDPMFHGEPWLGNTIWLTDNWVPTAPPDPDPLALPSWHIPVVYVHESFPDLCEAVLRPFSERTRHEQGLFTVWLRYRKGPS